jgi:hypothetical protein
MSEWRTHVKKVYDEMKKKDSSVLLKDALKAASKSWKKGAKAVGDRADDAKLGKKGGDCSSMSEVDDKKGGEDNMEEEVDLPVPAATAGSVDEDVDTDGAGGRGKKNKTGKKSKKSQKSKKGGKTKKNRKSKKTDIDLTDPKYMD